MGWIYKHLDAEPSFFRDRYYCPFCGDWQTYGEPPFCMYCGKLVDPEKLPKKEDSADDAVRD